MSENYKELIEQLKNGEITEEELFQLMSDNNGLFRLKRGKITKSGKEKKKLYFGGTIIGYKDEIKAPFNFMPGSHEDATPRFAGIPYMLFHNDNMFPIGEVTESWFDDEEVKYAAWSHDEAYNEAIEQDMMDSQSMGFEPTEYEFNFESYEWDIYKYDPYEMSGVVFPAYVGAKTEVVGDTLAEVKTAMTEITQLDASVDTITTSDEIELTTTTSSEDIRWNVSTSTGDEEKMEELRKENKMLKFLAKHPDMENREQIIELMEKYDLNEEDAEKLIIEKEEEEKEEVIEVEEPQIVNPPLPKNNEPVPTDKTSKEEIDADIDARIEDSTKRGFGIK